MFVEVYIKQHIVEKSVTLMQKRVNFKSLMYINKL